MKKYKIIYADPPWKYERVKQYQDNKRRFENLKPYSVMSMEAMCALPIRNVIDDNCACFLWTTDSHLKEGIELLEAWGFRYKTVAFNWIKKTNKGRVFVNFAPWTLKSSELCLLGTKGTMSKYKKSNNVRQLIEAERTVHSKKPVEAIKRIEELFGNIPRLEMFCRFPREGWDVWGDEVESTVTII